LTSTKGQPADALVVVSHPDPGSLNHALSQVVLEAWRARGHEAVLLDLHQSSFNPILDLDEARGRASSDAQIQAHIRQLQQARLLAVVHPNCWGAPPAMMKGWMDRVFAPGAAYAFPKGEDEGLAPVGLFSGKRALVINTSNTTAERERDAFGDPLERIWRDCLLGYCGFAEVQRLVFRVVATSTPAERDAWMQTAAAAAIRLGEPVREQAAAPLGTSLPQQ